MDSEFFHTSDCCFNNYSYLFIINSTVFRLIAFVINCVFRFSISCVLVSVDLSGKLLSTIVLAGINKVGLN